MISRDTTPPARIRAKKEGANSKFTPSPRPTKGHSDKRKREAAPKGTTSQAAFVFIV